MNDFTVHDPFGYEEIRHYGAIGNLRNGALVSRTGSIDWMCLPALDSPSVFGRILDARKGGAYSVRPKGAFRSSQKYFERTNVLQTTFETPEGATLVVTDFFALPTIEPLTLDVYAPPLLARIMETGAGPVDVEVRWNPHFDYGRAPTPIHVGPSGVVASYEENYISLRCTAALGGLVIDADGATFTVALKLNQPEVLFCTWEEGFALDLDVTGAVQLRDETVASWRKWLAGETGIDHVWAGKYQQHLERAELVLKLLTQANSGAIAAAFTTSLPEAIGGERNWDYRVAWIRDAALTVKALIAQGHPSAATEFLAWCDARAGEDEDHVRVTYPLTDHGSVSEINLDHLEGYLGSRPVRIGNLAHQQFQADVYGEILTSTYEVLEAGVLKEIPKSQQSLLCRLADDAVKYWREPDQGLWEMRGEPKHFVHSKIMVWRALATAVLLAEKHGLDGDCTRWVRARDQIREEILEKGFSQNRNSFVLFYGSEALDAANLLIPFLEFLPATDPRFIGTVDASLEELCEDDLVYRYRVDDGLADEEGAFVICSFWMAEALVRIGRVKEGLRFFDSIVSRIDDGPGIFSEQIDPKTGLFLGNTPQAFSHVGLINCLLALREAGADLGIAPASDQG